MVGLHDEKGKLVHICNVSSGLSQELLEVLSDFFQKTCIEKKGKLTLVEPLLVCEVAHQSVTREYSLRAPRFLRLRFDKKPNDCKLNQILGI